MRFGWKIWVALLTLHGCVLFATLGLKTVDVAANAGQERVTSRASSLDQEDADKLTALMRASAKGDIKTENSLAKGASVNAKSSDYGVTALRLAAFWGEDSVVSALLAKGANLEGKDSGDHTATDYAAIGGRKATTQLLQDKGGKLTPVSSGFGAFLASASMPYTLLEKASGSLKTIRGSALLALLLAGCGGGFPPSEISKHTLRALRARR